MTLAVIIVQSSKELPGKRQHAFRFLLCFKKNQWHYFKVKPQNQSRNEKRLCMYNYLKLWKMISILMPLNNRNLCVLFEKNMRTVQLEIAIAEGTDPM